MKRFHRHHADDAGLGLILVIGISAMVMGLVILGATIAERSLASSSQHVRFAQTLGAAEAGVDQTLARLQRAYVQFGTDYPVPSQPSAINPSPTCTGDPAAYLAPTGGFADQDAEEAWARARIAQMIAADPDCVQHTDDGDFAVVKPSNRQAVYAMGWSPSRTDPDAKVRLVKSEYLFLPYKPSNAVLTGGDLLINSSTLVTVAAGNDPTLAAVHSNGTISVPNGNPIVYGPVSSTGDSGNTGSSKFYANPGGTVSTMPAQPLPQISALSVYNRWSSTLHDSWYDLCPDGTMREPASTGPCTGTDIVADLAPGGADYGTRVRGFRWAAGSGSAPPSWKVGKNMPDGVYFAFASNIVPDTGAGNTYTANATIIAAAADEGVCGKVGGTIDWDHNNIGAPVIPNLFMLADADLTTESNFEAGSAGPPVVSGLFLAGDQVHMQTSSNGAFGAVIATDECAPSPGEVNEIKNPSVYFDPNAEAPFTDVINTTLWLEY